MNGMTETTQERERKSLLTRVPTQKMKNSKTKSLKVLSKQREKSKLINRIKR